MIVDLNKIATLDFETYYSTEYSLTRPEYNTSAYIRDEQFLVHCCAIKVGKKKSRAWKGKDVEKALRDIDWSTHALLAHNTAFDGFILAERYGIVPAFYLDTLSMTRGLHADVSRAKLDTIAKLYGIGAKHEGALENTKGLRELPPETLKRLMEYCNNDNELCWELFLKQYEVYPQDELELIDMTIRMFCDSKLYVDIPRAQKALAEEMLERRAMILRSGATEEQLQSNAKFAELLKKLGVEPPIKISLKTGHENFAFAQTDPEFLELLDHEDIRVVRLAEARLAAKSTQVETRAARLIQAGQDGQVLPVGYNYYAAKTGRWGGTNKLNLQNLPRGSELRRSIIAAAAHIVIAGDSAQIEARTLAWLAGQYDVLEAFRQRKDVYRQMASIIYGKPVDQITDAERFVGKVAILGLGYGMGGKKFQTTLALGLMGPPMQITLAEANRAVKLYRGSNKQIMLTHKIADRMLRKMCAGESGTEFNGLIEFDPQTIWLPNGMPINYPGLHMTDSDTFKYNAHGVWKKVYGGLVIENIVQALARIIVADQALRIKKRLAALKLRKAEMQGINMLTHDEIVAVAPQRLAPQVEKLYLEEMRIPPGWCADLPVNAEAKYASFYCK